MKRAAVVKVPCPDTPENRKALIDQMLAIATAERDIRRQGGTPLARLPFLLISHKDQLHHAAAHDCATSVFVVAEYARSEVTLIEKPFKEVRWVLPPVPLRVLPPGPQT